MSFILYQALPFGSVKSKCSALCNVSLLKTAFVRSVFAFLDFEKDSILGDLLPQSQLKPPLGARRFARLVDRLVVAAFLLALLVPDARSTQLVSQPILAWIFSTA